MPYAKNPYLEDEYGGVSPDPYVQDEYGGVGGGDDSYLAGEPMITMPGGAPQSYSNWMNQPSVSPTFEYPPMPSGKNTYSVATGESEWARKIREENEATSRRARDFSRVGSRSFFIPSGQKTTYKSPGLTQPGGPVMTAPTMGPMPEFKLPLWDESKIESKAQRAAGPGLRELRKGMREAQGRYYENPNVRRMTLRDAMAGYGMGLEKVLGGARKEAAAEYAAEYAPQMGKATAEYGGQINTMMAQYQAAWKEYLTRMQTVQEG